MIPLGPIHVSPCDPRPHLTVRDTFGETWHVPYDGQTTLDMFQEPNFDPHPHWERIARHNLGSLYEPGATPAWDPWRP